MPKYFRKVHKVKWLKNVIKITEIVLKNLKFNLETNVIALIEVKILCFFSLKKQRLQRIAGNSSKKYEKNYLYPSTTFTTVVL